jgi:hypothetical protein
MKICRVLAVTVAAVALMASQGANAGNKAKVGNTAVTTEANSTYNFRCVGPALNLMITSFSLPVSRSATDAATGAGAAKKSTSSLTIEFPMGKAYSTLYTQVIQGDHYSSCTLVETVLGSASGTGVAGKIVFTWTFSQVTPTNVTAIWKDASDASAPNTGAKIPTELVRATLNFSEVRLENQSGSSTTGAVDSWTQTQ